MGALSVVKYFRQTYKKEASYVTAKTNKHGQLDLEVSPVLLIITENYPIFILILSFHKLKAGIKPALYDKYANRGVKYSYQNFFFVRSLLNSFLQT